MPRTKIVCKEKMGFSTAAGDPNASGRGVFTPANLLVLQQVSVYNEPGLVGLLGFFLLSLCF